MLTEEDCQERLDRIYGGRVRLDAAMLAACDAQAILARMLRNLKAIYVKAEDSPRALRMVELLLASSPGALEELRDRGLLYAALDCYALAAARPRGLPGDGVPRPRSRRAGAPEDRGAARQRGARQLEEGDRMSTAKVVETSGGIKAIEDLLGADARALLEHRCQGIPKETLHLPGPDFVDRVHAASDRPVPVLRSLQQIFDHGRLAGTGYVSILPVDQGIEHSAGASFAKNPLYFDPENIVKLAIEGGLQRGGLHARRAGRRWRASTRTRSRSS